MLTQAINKLGTEMAQNIDNTYIQVVGDFLIKHLEANPGSAERILDPNKSIEKSLDEMAKVAQKKKKGNCAVLSDEEGFAIVLQYFGIEPAQDGQELPEQKVNFDVNLDDLLKG